MFCPMVVQFKFVSCYVFGIHVICIVQPWIHIYSRNDTTHFIWEWLCGCIFDTVLILSWKYFFVFLFLINQRICSVLSGFVGISNLCIILLWFFVSSYYFWIIIVFNKLFDIRETDMCVSTSGPLWGSNWLILLLLRFHDDIIWLLFLSLDDFERGEGMDVLLSPESKYIDF